jgi:hypothetical protein
VHKYTPLTAAGNGFPNFSMYSASYLLESGFPLNKTDITPAASTLQLLQQLARHSSYNLLNVPRTSHHMHHHMPENIKKTVIHTRIGNWRTGEISDDIMLHYSPFE